MKAFTLFTAFAFLFLLFAQAQQQEAVISKKGSNPVESQEVTHTLKDEPLPASDLRDGGGGYGQYFYYGDPTGMYLNSDWKPGNVAVKEGDDMEGMLRYNIYHQKVEAVIEGDTFAFAKPGELNWVMIGESKFIFSNFLRNDYEVAGTWFEVLCEGECDLLLRRYIKYRVTDGDDEHSDDQLYMLEEYYTRTKDESGKRLYTSKKDIPLVLLGHQEELSVYLKENKLNLKEKDDLVKLFNYYNSLE